jgi:U3 small nucleolar RNA-associated protein 14
VIAHPGSPELTAEELKLRQAELQKARAVLTYYMRKRAQMNKIKSKTYRKIRKRQKIRQAEKERATLEDLDPQAARALDEADAVKRMKERMSLKHKNTSKWVRTALSMGGTRNSSIR